MLQVMRFIYDNIMYAELNTKSDYCQCCGYDGEIKIVEDEHGKLIWRCPNCGNEDQDKMNVARRTCGYISFVEKQQQKSIKLIDGALLADLLVKYRVGVTIAQSFSLYKLDTDYFAE